MKFTIDGVEVPFTEGQTILEAARGAGIGIPALCAHEGLEPFGACRQCVVRVEGMKGFPVSCSTAASDGMVIHSDDEEVLRLRRNVMKLILSEHPHSCIVCNEREGCEKLKGEPEKAGRVTGCSTCSKRPTCELRKICDDLGLVEGDIPMEYKGLPLERDDPFLDRDYNLCILCGRCVRVCQEVQGASAIAFTDRSSRTKVGTLFERPHLDGPCRFCGACIDVCPTGALSARGSKWQGEPDSRTASTCAFCSLGILLFFCSCFIDNLSDFLRSLFKLGNLFVYGCCIFQVLDFLQGLVLFFNLFLFFFRYLVTMLFDVFLCLIDCMFSLVLRLCQFFCVLIGICVCFGLFLHLFDLFFR